jgi:hypothetical protein
VIVDEAARANKRHYLTLNPYLTYLHMQHAGDSWRVLLENINTQYVLYLQPDFVFGKDTPILEHLMHLLSSMQYPPLLSALDDDIVTSFTLHNESVLSLQISKQEKYQPLQCVKTVTINAALFLADVHFLQQQQHSPCLIAC